MMSMEAISRRRSMLRESQKAMEKKPRPWDAALTVVLSVQSQLTTGRFMIMAKASLTESGDGDKRVGNTCPP